MLVPSLVVAAAGDDDCHNPAATSAALGRRLGLALAVGGTSLAIAVAPTAAQSASTYTLQTLPDQGESAIDSFVASATKTLDMTMYELRDTTITGDLVNLQKSGVK